MGFGGDTLVNVQGIWIGFLFALLFLRRHVRFGRRLVGVHGCCCRFLGFLERDGRLRFSMLGSLVEGCGCLLVHGVAELGGRK